MLVLDDVQTADNPKRHDVPGKDVYRDVSHAMTHDEATCR